MKKQLTRSFFPVTIILGIFLFLAGCRAREPLSETRFFFNTACTIKIPAGEKNAPAAIKAAFDRIAAIDQKFSVVNTASPLYAFNKQGVPIKDKEIIALARTAFNIRSESQGAFDPTVYPLVILWGFYSEHPSLPQAQEIRKLLPLVGNNSVKITADGIYPVKKGAGLDLAGVVSGYGADEALKVLKNIGIKSALIDTGGEFYALGTNLGNKWRIGLKNPRGEGIIGVIELQDEALATGGDYEKYFMANGKRYHHILNPNNGYPAIGLESVTIIGPITTVTDGWSTAFFVLGAEQGFAALSRKPGYKAIAVTAAGKIISSPETGNQFKPLAPY
jgi:FAD:protein FMN transferase